jgi:hypothetical protein
MRDGRVPCPAEQPPPRIGLPLHVRPRRSVTRLARDPELPHRARKPRLSLGTCPLRPVRKTRHRLRVVTQDAVVVPAAEVAQKVLRVPGLALRLEERRVHRDPAPRPQVPRDRQAPQLARTAAAIDARHVLLIAMAADRQRHIHVEQHPALALHLHVRHAERAARHRRAKPLRHQRLAGERRQHGGPRRRLRHRAMKAAPPALELPRMAHPHASDPASPPPRRSTGPHAPGSRAAPITPAAAIASHTPAGPNSHSGPSSRTRHGSASRRGLTQPNGHVAVVEREHRGLPAGRERHRHAPPPAPAPETACRFASAGRPPRSSRDAGTPPRAGD